MKTATIRIRRDAATALAGTTTPVRDVRKRVPLSEHRVLAQETVRNGRGDVQDLRTKVGYQGGADVRTPKQ